MSQDEAEKALAEEQEQLRSRFRQVLASGTPQQMREVFDQAVDLGKRKQALKEGADADIDAI